jgi:hypothetical protein
VKAQAQNTDLQQVKNYQIQALQALDSGDNIKAVQQLKLADDQMSTDSDISLYMELVNITTTTNQVFERLYQ